MNKLINKNSIKIVTVIIMLIAMIIFELFYCNTINVSNFLQHNESSYNFSLFRIVSYIVFFIIYFIFNEKFIDAAVNVSDNKCKKIVTFLFLILSIVSVFFIGFLIIKCNYNIRILSLILITILMSTIFVIYLSNNSIKNVVVFLFTFGLVFSVSTQFNHNLDEKRHFMTAFNIANFNLDYEKNPITDNQLNEIKHETKIIDIDGYLVKYKPNITNDVDMDDIGSTPTNYLAIAYIFPAIGIFLAKLLGGSIIDIYVAGRIFNLISYGLLIIPALKLLPYKKNIFAVIFCMPILLVLAASYSVDAYCVGTISLFIAYCLNLYKNTETISLKQAFILLGIFMLVLAGKSMSYICIGMLILILPVVKTLKKNKKYMPIFIIISILLVISLIFVGIYLKNNKLISDVRGGNTDTSRQAKLLITNPKHDVVLAINHLKSTILNFNWITGIHPGVFFGKNSSNIVFFMIFFLFYVALTEDDYNFDNKRKIILLLTFLAVFATTSLALYLSFTEVGKEYVDGYQTRYIFPLLPLVLICLSHDGLKNKINKNRVMNIAMISFILLIIGSYELILV